jgi:predicted transcriptional regulator
LEIKLSEGELKLMDLLWESEPVSAKALSLTANQRYGWNKNTTYTVIKKLVDKCVIQRTEPNFICTALVDREKIRKAETQSLIKKLYNGSKSALFSSLLEDDDLSEDELDVLRKMIEKR